MTRPIRDPAPSKWGYRWQRWMLTPGVRTGLRVGVPLALVLAVGGIWAAQDGNRALVAETFASATEAFRNRPEFIMRSLSVSGADEPLADRITKIAQIDFPVSSFDIDLEALRREISDLEAIAGARVWIGEAGTVRIDVVPRDPVALWRTVEGLRLIDGQGVFSGRVETRAERRDLPLIAGQGAESYIDEALTLFRRAGPISDRVRGLVRRGDRRWDMVLDRGVRIALPSVDPAAALDRVIAMHTATALLDRDVSIVDMRMKTRPTVRVSKDAVTASRNAARDLRPIEAMQ
ncbi:cell division protein FtsQ [Salipiger sp. IMCC34102]|uniref:cell division protein FtsQ/DivIB n=1 Tax=Salipiger sp. IMCC34102 TaxID=2510647 RepID=UPI00101C0E80|nr:cell division protein FtsQ/DivIB [Salipiger sp. IMCC34102]RYH02847.1 cell division protein FtsQ [Salipiger sp. IMCC34102]